MTVPSVFQNIYSIIAHNTKKTPDAIAIETPGRLPLTYAELLKNIIDVSAQLCAAGIKREDRVGIVLPNGPEMAITLLSVFTAAVCAPLNPIYQRNEFENYLSDLNIKLLIIQAGIESPARVAAERKGIPLLEMTMNSQSVSGQYLLLPKPSDVFSPDSLHDPLIDRSLLSAEPEDLAIVLHTSGTTARPKIVPLSHHNICLTVHYVCQALKLTPVDRCLSMMPQFHIGGLVDLLLAPLASGGTVICTEGFDSGRFFTLLNQYLPTWYQAVPSTLSKLLIHAKKEKIHSITSSLRFIRSVAAPHSPKRMKELESLFMVPVIETYGMTEAAPLITTNPLPPDIRKSGSTGKSVGPDINILDEQGNRLPTGKIGEIAIRGENVISGYEKNPEANMQAFRHGWFHTGDIGFIDEDNYLFLKGRVKEIINRGGEKILPQEVDSVLLSHPKVAQALSFSVPHKILGEDVAAAVVLADGYYASKRELIIFAAKRLSIFKVPRVIYFLDDIPKGPTGKPSRDSLSRMLNLAMSVDSEKEYTPPRSQIELKMASIWSEVLKEGRISIYDNFFDLGGDSLRVVKLFLKIKKTFNFDLPLHTIFRYSCIADLSKFIESKEKDPAQKLLQSFQNAKQKPIFWVHYTFDSGNIPIIPLETYWNKSPGKDISGIRIDEIAADFVDQIEGYLESDQYILGGFSIGGLIALEVSRQLKDAGKEIPLLFIVDPLTPGPPIESNSMKFFCYLKTFLGLSIKEKIPYLWRRIFNVVKFSDSAMKRSACRLLFKFNKTLPYILRVYYAQKIFSHAAALYRPVEYFGETTIYFSKPYHDVKIEKWRQICPSAIMHVVDIDDHLSIIKPPWSTGWSTDLKQKLIDLNGRPIEKAQGEGCLTVVG